MARKRQPTAEVVDFAQLRARHRLATWRRKIDVVVDSNRRAIGRLYSTGALFSAEGARIGRDLLLAHQNLLKVRKLLERLADDGVVPAPRRPIDAEAVYRELGALLDRTSTLTHRTGHYLSRLRTDERP